MRSLIALLLLSGALHAQALPANLTRALARMPGVKLLDKPFRADDLVDLRKDGYWPPWQLKDLDGDNLPDTVAVVTRSAELRVFYGVIALHAKNPEVIQWVVPFGDKPITGLAFDIYPRSVWPLFCYRCDANPFLRWNGHAYEYELWIPGDQPDVGSSEGGKVFLYANPTTTARKFSSGSTGDCHVKILASSGTSRDDHWYLIQLSKPRVIQGWIPAEQITREACAD